MIELIYKLMVNHMYGFHHVCTNPTLVYFILGHILFDSILSYIYILYILYILYKYIVYIQLLIKYNKMRNFNKEVI